MTDFFPGQPSDLVHHSNWSVHENSITVSYQRHLGHGSSV